MYLSQLENVFLKILDQSRLEDVVLIVWEEEQSISGCHREETTGGKQKGNPENQPLGNQTFSALMDFQGCMEHKSPKILYWDQIKVYWC